MRRACASCPSLRAGRPGSRRSRLDLGRSRPARSETHGAHARRTAHGAPRTELGTIFSLPSNPQRPHLLIEIAAFQPEGVCGAGDVAVEDVESVEDVLAFPGVAG